jgi:hypothetical protein
MRCQPAQWPKAAAAGHMEACDSHRRASACPNAGLPLPKAPRCRTGIPTNLAAEPSCRRSGDLRALLRGQGHGRAWGSCRRCGRGHHRRRFQAERPAHWPSSNIACQWAKRGAHRCRSLFVGTLVRAPSWRAWAPGGHFDRPLEIAPLHCDHAQECSAAAAGCRATPHPSETAQPTCAGQRSAGPVPGPSLPALRGRSAATQ